MLWGDGSPTPRVPLRRGLRRGASCSPPSATTATSRSTSAPARRLDPRDWPSWSPSSPASPARSAGTSRCRTASRAAASTPPARRSCSASRRGRRCARAWSARSRGTGHRRPCMRSLTRRAVWARTRSLWSLIARHQPWSILGPLLVVQWLALAVFAVAATHNGWLYYQGGDQTYYWTDAHLLSQWTLPVALVGYALVVPADPGRVLRRLERPLGAAGGDRARRARSAPGRPALRVRDRHPDRRPRLRLLGGGALDRHPLRRRSRMFDQRYHEKYVDITLPQSLGLTVLADFPSTVRPARHRLAARPRARHARLDATPSSPGWSAASRSGSSRRTRSSSAPRCSACWSRRGGYRRPRSWPRSCPGCSCSRSGSSAGSASCPAFASMGGSGREHGRDRRRRADRIPVLAGAPLREPGLAPPAPEHRRGARVLLGGAPARVRAARRPARDRPPLVAEGGARLRLVHHLPRDQGDRRQGATSRTRASSAC